MLTSKKASCFVVVGICLLVIWGFSPASAQNPAPTVGTISPNTGSTNGGTNVTVTGTGFLAGATLTIGGSLATNVVVVNSTSLTATTGTHVAGKVDVVVTNSDGQSGILPASSQPLTNPGFESGLAAWTGTAGAVTVPNNSANAHSGCCYAEINKIGSASIFSADSTHPSVYYPVNSGDQVTFGGFAFRVSGDGLARWKLELTDVNKLNPAFYSTAPSNVTTAAWTQEQSTVTVPAGKSYARFYAELNQSTVATTVRFDDATLLFNYAQGGFTYVMQNPAPTVSAISPNTGSTLGGTNVTITGTGFLAGATVTIGGSATNVLVKNSTTITATTPANAAGPVNVVVTSGGQSGTLPNGYTFFQNPPPTVSGISPNTGSTNGGTHVTVTGTGFLAGATLTIGGSLATNVVVVNSTSLTATTGTHVAGQAGVVVTNSDGQSGILPASSQPLTNPGFESGLAAWTGTAGAVTAPNNSANAHSGCCYAEINKTGSASIFSADSTHPSVYYPVNSGDQVTFGGFAFRVSGDGLARWKLELTDVNKLNPTFYSTVPSNVTAPPWTQEQNTITVPAGKSYARFYAELSQSTVAATVRFDDATLLFNYAQGGFTYVAPNSAPTVSSVGPNTGSTSGGTRVTIVGTGFLSGAVVALGAQPATNVAVVNSTTITAVAPAGAAGAVTVSVTNTDNQVGTLPNGYTYAAPSGNAKVFLLAAENHSYQSVVGSTAMPYLNSLIPQYGLATQYFADAHPSIGNYFMLTTGQILTINDKFPGTISDDNLVRHILGAGKTWKSYAESLPSAGYIGNDVSPYVKRHNPFAYFTDVVNSSTQKLNLVPFSQFATDMGNSQLPDFSFIVPNVNNDAHDCPAGMTTCTDSQKLAAFDSWLQSKINPLITSAAFQMNGTLVIVFDESFGADLANGGGQVAMLVISSKAKPGYRSTTFYQHENTLKLLSKTLGLSSPGAAAMASDMAEFFPNGIPVIPPVTASPTSIFFGDQPPGTTSAAHPILVRNNQSGNLTITSLVPSGDFTETDNCQSPNPALPPGGTCTINVKFAPTTTGGRTGTITINDGASTSPQKLYLSGNGAAAVLSPIALVFGNQALGSNSAPQAVTLTNTQSTPVTISSIATAGDFSQTNNCGSTLGAGLFCTINVIFTPTAAGARSGSLTVTDSAANSPQTATLSGTGTSAVTLNPSSMTFSNQALNTNSAPAAVQLTNNQNVALNISSIVTSGNFSQTNGCIPNGVLASGASCTIQVTFRPTATGTRTGALTVNDDAPSTPQTVSLSGFGVTSTTVVGPCPLSSTSPSVTICSPGNGLAVDSPVRVIAGTKGALTQMQIAVDGAAPVYTAISTATTLDTGISLPLGTHQITVTAKDSTATVFSSTNSVNVVAITPTCLLSTTGPSVTICTPGNGTTITSPVHVVAGTTDSNAVTSMQILTDGVAYTINQGLVDTYIDLPAGNHTLVVQAQDSASNVFSNTASVTVGDLSKISHIVWFIQENRSFDNYFGRLGQYRRDRGFSDPVDDLPLSVALPTAWTNPQFINPFHFVTYCHESVSSEWNMVHVAYNNGKMDSFMRDHAGTTIDPFNTRDIGYYDWNDLPPYYFLATQFATSDRYFSSMLGQTDPNRMYSFAATSLGQIISQTSPAGGYTQPTIFDQLDKAGVSWRYYYQTSTLIDLKKWSTWTRDSGKVVPIANYYNDIQNESTLPKVIFIERSSSLDEHTGNSIQTGAANSVKIINALLQSPSWASSVFILTFDEGGGMYDHVVPAPLVKPDAIPPSAPAPYMPAPGDFGQSGERVPFFILSPYVRPHYLSHTVREHGSILKLIESRFGLPPLTFRDAAADNMSEFFDFTSPLLLTPPALPTQPTGGLCDFNSEKAPGF